jgi:hypothetical protein
MRRCGRSRRQFPPPALGECSHHVPRHSCGSGREDQLRNIAIISRTPLPRKAIRPTSFRRSKAAPKSGLLPATKPAVNQQPIMSTMLTMSIAASQATRPPFIREASQLAGSGGE